MTKLIAIVPVRNEGLVIRRCLQALSAIVDAIVVSDQDSTDRTVEICKEFPKVNLVRTVSSAYSSHHDYQTCALNGAREFDGKNFILAVDADEILSANILEPATFGKMLDALSRPGTGLQLPWLMLWRDPRRYRVEQGGIWTDRWQYAVFWDDREMSYPGTLMHMPRIPTRAVENAKRFNEIKLLHYQFVMWERTRAKQIYYHMVERAQYPDRSPFDINRSLSFTRDERNMQLAEVEEAWINPWIELGIDLNRYPDDPQSWYLTECLRLFETHGPNFFSWLNIWDMDWEGLCQELAHRNVLGVPEEPIRDPRSELQRCYHDYINRRLYLPRGFNHVFRQFWMISLLLKSKQTTKNAA